MLSNELERLHYLDAPKDNRDPTIPGDMYRIRGFSLITANIDGHSIHVDKEAIYVIATEPLPPHSVGHVRDDDVVMFVSSHVARDGITVYKIIKGDEMGYVPSGRLVFTHITEKDVNDGQE